MTVGPFGTAWAAQGAGDYQFQSTCANTAGPDVGQYLDGAPGAPTIRACASSDFTTDTVNSQTQHALNLPVADQGVEVPAPANELVNGPGVYTIALCTKLDDLNNGGYVRLIDFKDGQTDNGLYEYTNGALDFYPYVISTDTPITAGTYHQIVVTRDASGTVTGYVDGAQEITFDDSSTQDGVITAGPDSSGPVVRFRRDNDSGPNSEATTGTIARIQIFPSVLSTTNIAGLGCASGPPTSTPETPAAVLLPASAAALLGGGLIAWRRRNTQSTQAA
jgi:hypothetical protein